MLFYAFCILVSTERVGISWNWLRPVSSAAYVACLPLLCQGSKWLSGKECLTAIQKVLGSNPSRILSSYSLSKNVINELNTKLFGFNQSQFICTNMSL